MQSSTHGLKNFNVDVGTPLKKADDAQTTPKTNFNKEADEVSKQESINEDKEDINTIKGEDEVSMKDCNTSLTDKDKTQSFLKSITSLKAFKKEKLKKLKSLLENMHNANIIKTLNWKWVKKGDVRIVYSKHHSISVSKLISLLFSKSQNSKKISKILAKKLISFKTRYPIFYHKLLSKSSKRKIELYK